MSLSAGVMSGSQVHFTSVRHVLWLLCPIFSCELMASTSLDSLDFSSKLRVQSLCLQAAVTSPWVLTIQAVCSPGRWQKDEVRGCQKLPLYSHGSAQENRTLSTELCPNTSVICPCLQRRALSTSTSYTYSSSYLHTYSRPSVQPWPFVPSASELQLPVEQLVLSFPHPGLSIHLTSPLQAPSLITVP